MRRGLTIAVLVGLVLVGLVGVTAAWPERHDSATAPKTTVSTEQRPTSLRALTPLDCLRDVGLVDPQHPQPDVWRGLNAHDQTIVSIRRRASATDALEDVERAVGRYGEAVGRYTIMGADRTRGFTGDLRGAFVRDVTACLQRSRPAMVIS